MCLKQKRASILSSYSCNSLCLEKSLTVTNIFKKLLQTYKSNQALKCRKLFVMWYQSSARLKLIILFEKTPDCSLIKRSFCSYNQSIHDRNLNRKLNFNTDLFVTKTWFSSISILKITMLSDHSALTKREKIKS